MATTLLAERSRLGYLTAADLGRLADTTDATVVRTVQRLGFAGLSDPKWAMARQLAGGEVAARYAARRRDGDAPSALERHLAEARRAVEHAGTADVIAPLTEAARVLAAAERIVVCAAGPTAGIADYAAAQWERIGRSTATATGPGGPGADSIARFGAHDTVVVIASGSPHRWVQVVGDVIRTEGLPAVVLTDSLPAPSPTAVVVRTGRGRAGRPATHVATLVAVEALTAALADADPTRTAGALDRLTDVRRRLDQPA